MIRIRWSGGSSSVFSSELAACSLARSTWSIRKTRRVPLCGRNCARSFSSRVCGIEIWRSGPSGGEGDEIGMGGEHAADLRCASRRATSRASATVSRFAGRLRSSCSICSACPSSAAASRRARVALPTPSRAGEQQRLRQAVLRDHLLQRLGDCAIAPEVLKHGRSQCPRLRARCRRCRRGRSPA